MADTSERLLGRVCRALDAIVKAGEPYGGLFPSMMDRTTGAMLMEAPEGIPGQRIHDRSIRGSNLIHDESTLMTLYALGGVDGKYPVAADRYLKRFATHCTNTPTGLFPWGEHAYWDLLLDCVGNSYVASGSRVVGTTHDQLRAVPGWLWEKLAVFNPKCVERFGEGLHGHWLPAGNGMPLEYTRHAYLDSPEPYAGGHLKDNAPDFPRHGGFYIFDWAHAYRVSGRQIFLDEIQTMMDYWWNKRREDGLLLIESRERPDHQMQGALALAQTVSLAASLLEASDVLEGSQPGMAAEMRRRARVYVEGFLGAPHKLEEGVFLLLWHPTMPERTRLSPVWGSKYGHTPASYTAGTCLCVYRMTGDLRLLDWAAAVGRGYLREAMPSGTPVPAMDAGMGIGLLCDLYDITREEVWRESASVLAERVEGVYFDDAPLPRGAAGIDWYESQMGPGFLLHGMARSALLAQGAEGCPLGPDYTGR